MTEAALPPPPPAAALVPPGGTTPGRGWLTGLDPATRRSTFIVTAILAGLFFGSQVLNEVIPGGANEVRPGEPIAIGTTARITPLDGWIAGTHEGDDGIRLEKGVVAVDLYAQPTDSPRGLAEAYLEQVLRDQATELTASDIEATTSASGSAARFTYQGLFPGVSGAIEGEVTVVMSGGRAVIADAWAPQGRLDDRIDEVHQMLLTIEIQA